MQPVGRSGTQEDSCRDLDSGLKGNDFVSRRDDNLKGGRLGGERLRSRSGARAS